MTDIETQAAMSDHTAVALTMWAEGRSEPIQGLIAVGCVIRNRLRRYLDFEAEAPTYRAVCLAPKQFSCWIPAGGASNYATVMTLLRLMQTGQYAGEDPTVEQCLFLADGIISGQLLDNTHGATSYYSPPAMNPPGRVPGWADGKPFTVIGSQHFYRA